METWLCIRNALNNGAKTMAELDQAFKTERQHCKYSAIIEEDEEWHDISNLYNPDRNTIIDSLVTHGYTVKSDETIERVPSEA